MRKEKRKREKREKRRNRTLMDMVMGMLINSNLPVSLIPLVVYIMD